MQTQQGIFMTVKLEASGLVRQFNGKTAVNGISFSVESGSCLGLLGPNGAGKTTTVEMLEGIQAPDAGGVYYQGEPLGEAFRNQAGIMFQNTALQDFITVRESLELFARLYPQRMPLEQLIEDCALASFLDQETASLSGGQRQRLLLAIALVNDPDVLFLDEPTTGLDPQSRHNFWQLVERIKARDKTIVLTTHYMEEAYVLCDRIIIMDHGEIIAEGTPKQLLASHFDDVVIHLPESAQQGGALDRLASTGKLALSQQHAAIEISTSDITDTLNQLLSAGVSLDGLQVRERTLEDLFLELTGKGLRQ